MSIDRQTFGDPGSRYHATQVALWLVERGPLLGTAPSPWSLVLHLARAFSRHVAGPAARGLLRLLVRIVHPVRVDGRQHVPSSGGALIVANHPSYADALLVGASLDRPARYLAYKGFCDLPLLGGAMRTLGAIPIDGEDRGSVISAIRAARAELRAGGLVCIFAEGRVTRDGRVHEFRPGLERIAQGLAVPIIPLRLSGVWGSVFSFAAGPPFWGWRGPLRRRVALEFGRPLPAGASATDARTAVLALAESEARAAGARA